MLLIDRYLLRQFLQVFLIFFISLTGLFIVFDAFTNLDEILRYGEAKGDLWATLGRFYACRSVLFFDRMSGILAMVAALFTVAWIQRYNELTALMAAGVSRWRVVRPVIVASLVVGLLAAVSRETLLPRLAGELGRSPKDLLGDVNQVFRPRFDHRTDILFRAKSSQTGDRRLVEPSLLLPAALDAYGNQIVAAEATYRPPADGHPGGYLLSGVTQPKMLTRSPSLAVDGQKIVITPHDEPQWLAPDQCFVVSQVTFDQMTGARAWRKFSSTPALIAGLHNASLDFEADVRVAVHARFVQPLLDVALLFLALPLVLARENRNLFVAVGLCIVVAAAFFLLVLGCQYLGKAYLIAPALAAWLPLFICVPAAVAQGAWIQR